MEKVKTVHNDAPRHSTDEVFSRVIHCVYQSYIVVFYI